MPHFRWRGIALDGQTRTGTLFASSQQDLDILLFKRDIALIESQSVKKRWIIRSVPRSITIDFFRNVSVLLDAGVLLPDALNIVQRQREHPYFQEIIHTIVIHVNAGKSLSQALQEYPSLFTPLMVQMVYVGQEAGTLGAVLAMLADYLDAMLSFHKQIRSAALMPCITLLFFIVIASVIVVGIIPQFVALFASFNQELPVLTRGLLTISNFMCSRAMVPIIIVFFIVIALIKNYISSYEGKKKWALWVMRMPGIKILVVQSSIAYFLQTMATLLAGGMQLPAALSIAKKSITNSYLQDQITYLIQEVEAGASLSSAMAQHPHHLFSHDVVAMVAVGEESGRLHTMLARIAMQYQERVKRLLVTVTTVFQPLLLIILGLLTALLIFAVYLPILQFSHTVR